MAFINLLMTNTCMNSCTADSFFSLHDSATNSETKINFVHQFIQKITDIQDFSGYNTIDEKFKKLILENHMSSIFKNEELLYSDGSDRRIKISKIPKDEIKRKKLLDKEKSNKPKKRSAQLAEISTIYEENELCEKKKQEINFQDEIKKIYKERPAKILYKPKNFIFESDKSNLIPEERKIVKKIRLSNEQNRTDSNVKRSRKKSNEKIRKIKIPILHSKFSKTLQKEQSISFLEQIEKIDMKKEISNTNNLKASFRFTPTNKTICISKIPTNNLSIKKSNSHLSNSYQFKPLIAKTSQKVTKATTLKTASNRILEKPKNKVKELIEQFGDKFKKATSNIDQNKKKNSPIRSSIDARKARLSQAKKESKRKSFKKITHFVKDIVKEINMTENNSIINSSAQSKKIADAVKKNPVVVNHKIGSLKPVIKLNIANNSTNKTPNRQKVTHSTFRIKYFKTRNQKNIFIQYLSQLNNKINPEDLKYDSNRCKKLMEAAKKKIADERIKRIGSTSTVSSLDCSEVSVSSLKQEQQSFKSVNSTFTATKTEPKHEVKKNTTFSIKTNNTNPIQKISARHHLINHNQKQDTITNQLKAFRKPKTINNKNSTILLKSQEKSILQKRSNSTESSFSRIRIENYGIEELASCDETDDEDEPSKPVPEWAKDYNLMPRIKAQAMLCVNFTKLFKATANDKIELEDVFKIKKSRFFFRSSSAEWTTAPVWQTGGLNGNESFRKLKKD